ncbi:hypothetical protein RMN56_31430 [Micromonospora halotolerans]|uniref:Tetratricopeptide repeat protein n=1 Tax=Micromonospora halotolerans TaxID=709879 RepID=A0ABY9ZWN7_9ACTN|nr:hypothetical protein [Micromonospora halotolerans]WNM39563.1 hypothetical protein RMN56_31430 [Micromonospora halotolerans]
MESQSTVGADAVARARELALAKQYEPAVAILREHLTTHPDDAVAWRRLAGALLGCDRPAAAVEAAGRAMDLAPDDVVAHRHRALALHMLGRHPESYADAKRAVELAPDDDEALSLLALNVLNVDRDPARARALARRALTANPDSLPARDVARVCRRIRRTTTTTALFLAAAPAGMALMGLWLITYDTGSAGDRRWITWPAVAAGATVLLSLLLGRSRRTAPPMLTPPQMLATMSTSGIAAAGAAYGGTRSLPAAGAVGLVALVISGGYSFLLLRAARRGAVAEKRKRAVRSADRNS